MCDTEYLVCPECGSPDIVVQDDNTCVCLGCGFTADIGMFLDY
jgi:transcription initiation factor TFIIIB Brf1 subunit/transcription initiation factor TFIIB